MDRWGRWPWARLIVVATMLGEGYYLASDPDVIARTIGASGWWAAAFIVGAVCLFVTLLLRPGRLRAVLAAVPIFVHLVRAFEVADNLDAPWYSGAVGVRVALAAMLLRSLGWSADTLIRIKRVVDDNRGGG